MKLTKDNVCYQAEFRHWRILWWRTLPWYWKPLIERQSPPDWFTTMIWWGKIFVEWGFDEHNLYQAVPEASATRREESNGVYRSHRD